ncbi:flippase [Nitrospira moscoviensis]|nr:flippase [Nitrospira moscoviensis]
MAVLPVSLTPPAHVPNQPAENPSPAHHPVSHLATNSVTVLLGSAFGNGLNYLFGLYLARTLGPVDFGLYALGITVFNILVLFAPLGMETAVMKFVSQAGSNGIASVRKTLVSAAGMAAGFGALLSLSLLWCANPLAREVFGKPDLAPVLVVLALAVPLAALSTILLSTMQALGQIRWMVLIRNGVEPVGKLLLAGIALSMGFGLGGVLGALLIAFLMSLVLSIGYLKGSTDFRYDQGAVPGGKEIKALLAFSMPLVVANLFGIVAPRSDLLAIGAYGASSDVAVYAVASQTSAVLALILSAFDAAIMPTIGGLSAGQDVAKLKHVSQTASRWAFTLSFFMFVQLALFGGDILRLFGPAFEGGAACLVILASGHLVGSAAVSSTGIVLMSGRSKTVMTIAIVVAVVLISSNLILVPQFGILGAAWATSFCVAMSSVLCVIAAYRCSGFIPYCRRHLKPLGAATLSLAAGFLLKSALVEGNALLLAPVVAGVYVGALLAMGVDDNDRRAFVSLFRGAQPMRRAWSVGWSADR